MAESANRISGLTVRGFKSLAKEQHIEIRPLTILAGANSSGKSSIMQPLLLLKQTLESPGDPGAILLDGEHVKFTEGKQLLSQCRGQASEPGFFVTLRLHSADLLSLHFRLHPDRTFGISRMSAVIQDRQIDIVPEMRHDEIVEALPKRIREYYKSIEQSRKDSYRWAVAQDRCFLAFESRTNEDPGEEGHSGHAQFLQAHTFCHTFST